MHAVDPTELFAAPPAAATPGAVRWYASEVVTALCARVDLPRTGPHVRLLRGLLLAAWSRGESPSLDRVLDAALRTGWAEAGIDPGACLALSLRFLERAPELGGLASDLRGRLLREQVSAARALLIPVRLPPTRSALCERLDARAAA